MKSKHNQKLEIFKVQRALESSINQPPVLVYSENRSILLQLKPTKALLELFEKDEYKIFMYGFINDKHRIEFTKRAEWQEW